MISPILGVVFMMIMTALEADKKAEISTCSTELVSVFGANFIGIFNQTCFMFITDVALTYGDALRKCQLHNGTLAQPKTKDVNEFLLQEMKRFGQTQPMWIGMHDKTIEGEYVWEDGTKVEPWGNIEWTTSWFNSGEDCIALNPTDEKWHDYKCADAGFLPFRSNLSFICQFSMDRGAQRQDAYGDDDQEQDAQMDGVIDHGAQVDDDQRQEDKVNDDNCKDFNCPHLDCGMNGFKIVDGCQLCECATKQE